MDDDEVIGSFTKYLRVDRDRSERTVQAYISTLERLQEYILEMSPSDDFVSLSSLGKDELRSFLRHICLKSGERTTRPSWNKHLSALRTFYGWLYREEMIASNPAALIERFKISSKERVPLTIEELIRLAEAVSAASSAATRLRNTTIVLLLIHTGLRISEVVNLTYGQIDLEHQVIRSVTVKGNKSVVAVLNDVVCAALRAYLEQVNHVHEAVGIGDGERVIRQQDDAPLFASPTGNAIGRQTVYRKIREAGELAGIGRRVTPHLLRHSYATCLAELEVPIATIQVMLSHTSAETTSRYVHLGLSPRHKASSAFATLWCGSLQ